jgi:hypothetical protein
MERPNRPEHEPIATRHLVRSFEKRGGSAEVSKALEAPQDLERLADDLGQVQAVARLDRALREHLSIAVTQVSRGDVCAEGVDLRQQEIVPRLPAETAGLLKMLLG